MNFLAHALLADHAPALRVGGVMGDFVKGPLPAGLPDDLAAGVALHRAIDSYADRHPAFQRSRQRLEPALRRWSGVLIDIYYDHLLARNWPHWHGQTLKTFSENVYDEMLDRMAPFPAETRRVCQRMCEQDWFGAYADIEGIRTTLARMSRRVRRDNPLAGGEAQLITHLPELDADCTAFITDARRFAASWINARASE